MTDPFDTPAENSTLKLKDIENECVLIFPMGVDTFKHEDHGTAEVIRANVAVLTGEREGYYENTILFGAVVYDKLKNMIGKKVLTVITKPKGKRYWDLTSDAKTNPEYVALATAFMAKQAELTKAEDPFA